MLFVLIKHQLWSYPRSTLRILITYLTWFIQAAWLSSFTKPLFQDCTSVISITAYQVAKEDYSKKKWLHLAVICICMSYFDNKLVEHFQEIKQQDKLPPLLLPSWPSLRSSKCWTRRQVSRKVRVKPSCWVAARTELKHPRAQLRSPVVFQWALSYWKHSLHLSRVLTE